MFSSLPVLQDFICWLSFARDHKFGYTPAPGSCRRTLRLWGRSSSWDPRGTWEITRNRGTEGFGFAFVEKKQFIIIRIPQSPWDNGKPVKTFFFFFFHANQSRKPSFVSWDIPEEVTCFALFRKTATGITCNLRGLGVKIIAYPCANPITFPQWSLE